MKIRDPSKSSDPPPNYDPNDREFTLRCYVDGKIDGGSYVGGNVHTFDHANGDTFNIDSIKRYENLTTWDDCSYLVFSLGESGKFEVVGCNEDVKLLLDSALLGDRILTIYYVVVDDEGSGEGVELSGEDDTHDENVVEREGDRKGKRNINEDVVDLDEDHVICVTDDEHDSSEEDEYVNLEDLENEDGGDCSEGDSSEGDCSEELGERGGGGREEYVEIDDSGDSDIHRSGDDYDSAKGSDSENDEVREPTWNPNNIYNPNLKLGMIFTNKWQFIEAVHADAIAKRRDIKVTKNEPGRVYAKCLGNGCDWKIHANIIPESMTFQVRLYTENHSCPQSFKVSSMKARWLVGRYGYQFKDDPKKKVTNFKDELEKEMNIKITDYHVRRAKKLAVDELNGRFEYQFGLLWDYAEEIRRTNLESTVLIDVIREPNGPAVFDKMYICLGALKEGFSIGCRPIVGIDGCHLKGHSGGILLSAVGIDPNNNILPIAYGVVGKENGDTWSWFLLQLKSDLGIQDQKEWTFISDKQKGIIQAFDQILPNAHHRFCVRHLQGNMRNAGFGQHAFKDAVFRASKATTTNEFERRLLEIKELSPLLHKWLEDKGPKQWCRAYFDDNARCDLVMNNICESFNAAILEARDKPILSMLEWLMDYLRDRVRKCRERAYKGKKWKGMLCPRIQPIINERVKRIGGCKPMKEDDSNYQIKMSDGTQFAVDLHNAKCGCMKWDLTGILCIHAIRAIYCQGLNPENFTDACYRVSTYKMVYDNSIMPLNGRDLWKPTGIRPVMPPNIGRQAGRPKKGARRKDADEPGWTDDCPNLDQLHGM